MYHAIPCVLLALPACITRVSAHYRLRGVVFAGGDVPIGGYATRDKKLQYNFLCKNIYLRIITILALVVKIFCINCIPESVKLMIHYTTKN
jgi:hypothetical protein